MKKTTAILLFLSLFSGLSAQDTIRLTVSSELDITRLNVTTTAYDRLLEVLEGAVNTYQSLGNFYDPLSGKPAPQAAGAFRNLFKPNALLFADFTEEAGAEIGVADYCRDLAYYFAEEGFQFAIRRAALTELWWDTLYQNKYLAAIVVDKEAFNRLSTGRQVKPVPAGRGQYQLLLRIEVSPDFGNWQIREITRHQPVSGVQGVVDDFSTYLSLQAAGSHLLPTFDTQPLWEQPAAAGAQLTHAAGPAFAVGIQLTTNRWLPRLQADKHWYLLLGLHYGRQSLQTDMQNYAVAVEAEAGGLTFERQGSGITASEQLTISSLGLPLGVGWSFKSSFSTRWMIEAVVLPAWVLQMEAVTQVKGDYMGNFQVGNQLVQLPGPPEGSVLRPGNEMLWEDQYGLGRELKASLMPKTVNALGMWLRLSPAVSFDFNSRNPALGMLLALDASFNLRPLLQQQAYEQLPLGRVGDLPGSLAAGWLSGLRHHSLGVRLGLYYHFRKSNN